MPPDKLALEGQQPLSDSLPQDSSTTPFSEQSLDDHLEAEHEEIAELDEKNKEDEGEETSGEEAGKDNPEVEESAEDEPEAEVEAQGDEDYKPNTKYKVLDEEHEFDPKLKDVLTEETEPIIRELYEKAHGIEVIKRSREAVTKERDELRGNYNNIVGEVGRVLNYRRSGDLQSFFESVQLTDEQIANYILEKARIAQLPPDERAVYNERETFRRRMNALEQNFQQQQSTQTSQAVQARIAELDAVLTDEKVAPFAKAFEARNGKGSFKQAVMEHGAAKWHATKKDLSAREAVDSFVKMTGITAPKGQPKPGPNASNRVVTRPKVKTIPNYGGSQASVTATQKPKSIEDLKKIRRDKYGS